MPLQKIRNNIKLVNIGWQNSRHLLIPKGSNSKFISSAKLKTTKQKTFTLLLTHNTVNLLWSEESKVMKKPSKNTCKNIENSLMNFGKKFLWKLPENYARIFRVESFRETYRWKLYMCTKDKLNSSLLFLGGSKDITTSYSTVLIMVINIVLRKSGKHFLRKE